MQLTQNDQRGTKTAYLRLRKPYDYGAKWPLNASFYGMIVKDIRNGNTHQTLLCKDKNRRIIADEKKCIAIWAKYFQELLKSMMMRDQEYVKTSFQTAQPKINEPTLGKTRNDILK